MNWRNFIIYDKTNYETVLSVNLKKENNKIDFIYDSKLENFILSQHGRRLELKI